VTAVDASPREDPSAIELPLVAVFLGTDHHRFDRLLDWVSAAAADGWARWFVQHGTTACRADGSRLSGAALLDADGLAEVLTTASAVVTHGGPGLIMDAHLAGHLPVVVPRDPAHHEHVDGHQLRFAAHLAVGGRIRVASDADAFTREVRAAVARGRAPGGAATAGASDEVSRRFGELVTAARRRRTRSARRSR
jgi:UDP-N-acetylglucosamine transferase subunit ALG13